MAQHASAGLLHTLAFVSRNALGHLPDEHATAADALVEVFRLEARNKAPTAGIGRNLEALPGCAVYMSTLISTLYVVYTLPSGPVEVQEVGLGEALLLCQTHDPVFEQVLTVLFADAPHLIPRQVWV